jgi:molecular chaperone Hsp33
MNRPDGPPAGDYLARAMNQGATLRLLAVRSTGVGAELVRLHECLPTGGAALVRIATACLLMGATIKGRQQVGLQIRGDGPLGELLAIADARGHVRATADNPRVALPRRADGKFDIAGAIGPGNLTVTKSLGLKDPYTSVVPLVAGEIASDLAYYFTVSEQKPAAMGLGERFSEDGVEAAGGFLIQAFPGADEGELARVEEAVAKLPPVSDLLAEGHTPEGLLQLVVPDAIMLGSYPVARTCTCRNERFEAILLALGEEELRQVIDQQEVTELRCHFCNRVERFSRDQLQSLLARATNPLH